MRLFKFLPVILSVFLVMSCGSFLLPELTVKKVYYDTEKITVEFSDTNLAKVEIKGKYLKGSVVIVEYKIRVTNNGEVAGYAKKIADYKPSELKFNSKINPDWYQSGNVLYTTSSNTGLTNNKAEIEEYYNSQGIIDEILERDNDTSQADLIISVSTGAAIKYMVTTLIISLISSFISSFISLLSTNAFIIFVAFG